MKKIILITLSILIVLFLVTSAVASTLDRAIIPADVNWLLHFDIEKFSGTHLRTFIDDPKLLGNDHDWAEEFLRETGINPRQDLDSLTLYSKGGKSDTVVCIKGRLDRAHLLGLLKKEKRHQEIAYGSNTIHRWGGKEFGVFVGEDMLMFSGSELAIKSALDVVSGRTASLDPSTLVSDATDSFLTAFVRDVSGLVTGRGQSFILEKMGMLRAAAMETEEGLRLKLDVDMTSVEDAQNMQDIVKGLIALGNMRLAEAKSEIRLPDNVGVQVDGKRVRLDIVYPTDKMIKIILGLDKGADLFF